MSSASPQPPPDENLDDGSLDDGSLDDLEVSQLRARTYAVCALCIASASSFFLTGVAPLPVLLYFPIARRWSFTPNPTELAMDFYGRSLLALLAGVAAALSIYAVMRVIKSARPGRLLLLTGYAATALLLAAGLFAYQLSVRVPTPLPLPHPTQPEPAQLPAQLQMDEP